MSARLDSGPRHVADLSGTQAPLPGRTGRPETHLVGLITGAESDTDLEVSRKSGAERASSTNRSRRSNELRMTTAVTACTPGMGTRHGHIEGKELLELEAVPWCSLGNSATHPLIPSGDIQFPPARPGVFGFAFARFDCMDDRIDPQLRTTLTD